MNQTYAQLLFNRNEEGIKYFLCLTTYSSQTAKFITSNSYQS